MDYLCRHCNANLDGGDIFEQLSKEPEYAHYTFSELVIAALDYGWTVNLRKHFTHELLMKYINGSQAVICPMCEGVDPLMK